MIFSFVTHCQSICNIFNCNCNLETSFITKLFHSGRQKVKYYWCVFPHCVHVWPVTICFRKAHNITCSTNQTWNSNKLCSLYLYWNLEYSSYVIIFDIGCNWWRESMWPNHSIIITFNAWIWSIHWLFK